ncbi:MAG: glycosyltransferase [Verrucomicrobiota bacterium]
MKDTRCLWLTRRFPYPPNSGEWMYSRGMVESLAAAGARVHGLCWEREETGDGAAPSHDNISWTQVGGFSGSRLRSILAGLPSDAHRHGRGSIRTELKRLLSEENWNAVIIDHAAMGWALPLVKRRQPGATVVYLSHNAEAKTRREIAAELQRSLPVKAMLRWDAEKYVALERRLCRMADLVSAITADDAAFYRNFAPMTPVMQNAPGYDGKRLPARTITSGTPRRVVLSGSFEWVAKQHNLRRFLEASSTPFSTAGIEVQVVGKASSTFAEETRRRFPYCRFDINVPSVSPFLNDARIGVIPEELGGGFKLKALDYVFHGLPVALLNGAAAGLPLDLEHDVIPAPNLDALAARIVEVIDDLPFLDSLRANAFTRCEDEFHWRDRGLALLGELERLRQGVGKSAPEPEAPPAFVPANPSKSA